MKLGNLETLPRQTLTLEALCHEIESEYHTEIKKVCSNILKYLHANEEIPDAPKSISELVHIIFYQLNYEIRQCFVKERSELFPLIIKAKAEDTAQLNNTIQSFKEAHQLILSIAQKLRHIMYNYNIQQHWSKEFRGVINDFLNLENNIYRWTHLEEDLLFPKVCSDVAKEKFISTVFR